MIFGLLKVTKEYTYGLKYKIIVDNNDNQGFPKSKILEAAEEDNQIGGCDALLFFSILRPEDGSFSIWNDSYDGFNEMKPISSIELFKVWAMLATKLKGDPNIHQWHRDIAEIAAEQVFANIEGRHKG